MGNWEEERRATEAARQVRHEQYVKRLNSIAAELGGRFEVVEDRYCVTGVMYLLHVQLWVSVGAFHTEKRAEFSVKWPKTKRGHLVTLRDVVDTPDTSPVVSIKCNIMERSVSSVVADLKRRLLPSAVKYYTRAVLRARRADARQSKAHRVAEELAEGATIEDKAGGAQFYRKGLGMVTVWTWEDLKEPMMRLEEKVSIPVSKAQALFKLLAEES